MSHYSNRPPSSGRYAAEPRHDEQTRAVAETLCTGVPDRDITAEVAADALRRLRSGPIDFEYILPLATIVAWTEGHHDVERVIRREMLEEAS